MEKYMNISHEVMTDIYNMSTSKKDYNFGMFTHNRERLAEMLEFADNTRNSLIINKAKNGINLVLIRGKSNYISDKKVLFSIDFDHNMIKSRNSMNILNGLLSQLEYQIGNNDLLEIERQRGFLRNKSHEVEENDFITEDEIGDDFNEENQNLW